jgi:hypothetical protein
MSQESSLTQSAHSVRQVLMAYRGLAILRGVKGSKRSPDGLERHPGKPSCVARPPLSRLLGVHQDKQYSAGLPAAIDPGMIGRLLNHDVACLHVNSRGRWWTRSAVRQDRPNRNFVHREPSLIVFLSII